MKKKIFALLFGITMVFTFYACDPETGAINLFSDSDDVQLGLQVEQEMAGNVAEYPIFNGDPSIKAYITQRIFNHILASPDVKKKSVFQYKLEIVHKDDVYNAFALPGGPVYVYTGLLKYLDSEAALAGIIAHEIAHCERRHATNRMTAYYGVSILISLLLGQNPSELAQIAANLFVGIGFLANSRSDENEADEYSVTYLRNTRYYPGAVKFFFEKMRDDGLVSSQSNSIATFLSTHPDPIDRIKDADNRMKAFGIPVISYTSNNSDIYRNEYLVNIKNKLP
ncbi:MAG: M48 family metalloprotease [Ignavibacteriales bacterium]|jgi:predicted Zn-dependent protease|nr:M48 family metalloprotease [Ignavibacteriaceae bacterium]NLH60872.1 M48 family metalloprotease [Ignavibacteriales bacterium]HOJ18780.1 M48 family metalloprotease [Ignavibacteriaceae bacterium]